MFLLLHENCYTKILFCEKLKLLLQSKISKCPTASKKRHSFSNIYFSIAMNFQLQLNEPGQRPVGTSAAGTPFEVHLHLYFYTL